MCRPMLWPTAERASFTKVIGPRQLQQLGPQLREHAPPLHCQAV